MAYVGIDQSYSGFGLVVLLADSVTYDAHLGGFPPGKYVNSVERLLAIEDWIRVRLAGHHVDQVCMEGYANGAKFGREQAGELGYAVKRVLWHHPQQLVPNIVKPTSLKKYTTGSGGAKKNEMLLAVYKKWGVEFKDDNLADAYALARVAMDLNELWVDGPRQGMPKYQLEVLETVG